jgi:hypothetical protein
MHTRVTRPLTVLAVIAAPLVLGITLAGQAARGAGAAQDRAGRGAAPAAPFRIESFSDDTFLRFPLAPADQAYAAIDGRRLKQHVNDLAAISRRYRDAGHQFWGRIIGTDADHWNAEWMMQKLQAAGATNVRKQEIPLPPQWMPRSWDVAGTSAGRTVPLPSAWPSYSTPATPAGGLDLEAVYLGWGTEADYAGRDVRGKAAFIYSMPMSGSRSHSAANLHDSLRRAQEKGAAALFVVIEMPGNIRLALYPQGTSILTFSLGSADGAAMRELIEKAPAGQAPHVKVRLDVDMVANLTTSNVWGEIPGTTDESIVIIAHRDGFFDAGSDNASGVATAVGLAEYFGKIPQAERRRTIKIIGTTGHHNNAGGSMGVRLLAENNATVFGGKTAYLINAEHTAHAAVERFGGALSTTNVQGTFIWGATGSPAAIKIAVDAYDAFGIPRRPQNSNGPGAEASRVAEFAAATTGLIHAAPFFHSDAESPETIPAAGLEASTRAYARIIDQVNKLTMEQLKGAPAAATRSGR